MPITDASNIDITFSYPKSDIDTPNGYFEWRDSINAKYNKYIVSNFYFDINTHILVVKHKNSTDNLYLIFDTVNTTNSDNKLTNLKIIHLNHIIGNSLLNIPKLDTNLKYDNKFYSGYDTANKYVYFNKTKLSFDEKNADNNITDIPENIKTTLESAKKAANDAPDASLNTFIKGMFINDEMECGESTIGSETIAKNKYATTVAGNLGIGIGGGILIIVIVIAIITLNKDVLKFTNTQKLFSITDVANGLVGGNNTGKLIFYNICWALLLLLSIICFIAYGGVMLDEKKSGRDSTVSGLLATAIISLILFIIMIGYKGLVLTPAA
jgi:hypothetical protein